MAHAITIKTNEDGKLLFSRMTAREHLGRLFEYRVDLLSQDTEVDLRKLLGTSMTVKLEAEGYTRHFNGIVSEAAQTGFQTIRDVQFAAYQVILVPKPWLLTRKQGCRIYSKMSVPEMVRAVLGDAGYADVKLELTGSYPKRDYCVQYRETDFNFISRLMEQEGIYYYFNHASGNHTMVLADALGAHSAVAGFKKIPYAPPVQQGKRQHATISRFTAQRSVNELKVELTNYDPLNPKTSLAVDDFVDDNNEYHGLSELQVFDYPGIHVSATEGKRYAQVRVEALNARHRTHAGETDACGLSTGALFTLADFPHKELDREYLVVGTTMRMAVPDYVSADTKVEPFHCEFDAIPSSQPYRSLPTAVKPSIVGLQTAVVVGGGKEPDEDIVVDKYGRVQVTFHWNKSDRKNAQNSCPVRVASPWAGKSWGAVSIPRVGQEVVVSFLEGDPDQPLIIGSVYNADNLHPYALPDNKTQSGIKSRSLLGGTADFNELRFEDKKGSEDFFMHAQKDMHLEVENDRFVAIDHDETIIVKNDQSLKVDHDQTESVGNDRKHTVGNNDALEVKQNGTTQIGQKFKLSAGSEIELVTGASSIVMKSSGDIEIKGVNIKITGSTTVKMEGQAQVDIKAGAKMDVGAGASLKVHCDAMVEVAGGAMATVKAPMLMLKGDGMVQMSGGIIMIG